MSNSAWEEIFDASASQTYFYNRITGESSWTLPLETRIRLPRGWEQAFDQSCQRIYYYNIETGETTWDAPQTSQDDDYSFMEYSVLRLQSIWRSKRARRQAAKFAKELFEEVLDPSTGQKFYYNRQNGQSSWKKPALLLLASQMNVDNNDSASSVNSDDFAKELQDVVAAAQHDNSDEEEENEQKSKRKYPRSKAQVLVDEAEDLEGEGEHVHNLDLSNLKAWKISSRVWNLLHIETLNLSGNKLKRIPSGIQDLIYLKKLNISHNELQRLPSCLQSTTGLLELFAGHNKITSFSHTIWKLRSLRKLDLSHNLLQELPYVEGDLKLLRETREWEVGIGLLTELEELKLSNNHLKSLPASLEKCICLKFLDVSNNIIYELTEDFGNLDSLRELYLANNHLSSLPESIGNLRQLQHLHLQGNQLASLPHSIGDLQNVREIIIERNKLNKLPDEFGTLSKLENLAMDSNYNFFSFSATFRTLCSVKTLTASKSGIYAFDSDEFLIHSPLEHLDLSENSLSELPSLQKSKMISTLLRLILFRNSFTVFPQVLLSCTHLQEINLSSNKLKFLPSEIRQLHDLHVLDLSQNDLSYLPSDICEITSLQKLQVDRNQLLCLPTELDRLQNLEHLSVSFNLLETLPTSLGAIRSLKSLNASHNRIFESPLFLWANLPNSGCQADFSDNPFNEVEIKLKSSNHGFHIAIDLMQHREYDAAEKLFTSSLEHSCNTFKDCATSRPEKLHARGVCRFLLIKEIQEKMKKTSDDIQVYERDVTNAHLILTSKVCEKKGKSNIEWMNLLKYQSCDLNSKRVIAIHARAKERSRCDHLIREALHDLEEASAQGVELPTSLYIQGLLLMDLHEFAEVVTRLTKFINVRASNPDTPIPPTSIPAYILRAEAFKQLGQLPLALQDYDAVLKYHPIEEKVIEWRKECDLSWSIEKCNYHVDNEVLLRVYDMDSESGLCRLPCVEDPLWSNMRNSQKKRTPDELFNNDYEALRKDTELEETTWNKAWKTKEDRWLQLLSRARDTKKEIKENVQMEREEARQIAVEQELKRLVLKRKFEAEREINELLKMRYEEEYTRWLDCELLKLENDRNKRESEIKRRAEEKVLFQQRLARRGGKRQQISQRGKKPSKPPGSRNK